jgi:3-oxoadipate enol-lactonase
VPTVRVRDIDVYYDRQGNGPPLLLIMGLGAHSGAWAPNLPGLVEKVETIRFDNRGAGRTSAPDEPYSIRGMAEDTAAFMDAIGLDRAHVLGVSMGGMIAQELAINAPERVDRLVIACSRARAGELRRTVAVAQRALWEAGIPRAAIRAIQQPWGSTPQVVQDESLALAALELAARDPFPIEAHAYLRQLDATMDHDTLDRLDRIAAPTLVLVGAEDVLTPPAESIEVAERVPGSRLRILPRGGHGFSAEYPHLFNRAVLDFILEA